jgi:hypothetical protein
LARELLLFLSAWLSRTMKPLLNQPASLVTPLAAADLRALAPDAFARLCATPLCFTDHAARADHNMHAAALYMSPPPPAIARSYESCQPSAPDRDNNNNADDGGAFRHGNTAQLQTPGADKLAGTIASLSPRSPQPINDGSGGGCPISIHMHAAASVDRHPVPAISGSIAIGSGSAPGSSPDVVSSDSARRRGGGFRFPFGLGRCSATVMPETEQWGNEDSGK